MSAAAEDPVFAPLQGSEGLLQWATRIGGDTPRAASIQSSLLSHSKGYCDVYNFYSLKLNTQASVLFLKSKGGQDTMALYCPQEEEPLLLEALEKTRLLDWGAPLCFFFVPDSLLEPLQGLALQKMGSKLLTSASDLYVYDPQADAGDIVCPPGYRVQQLGAAAVEQMLSVWRYGQCSDRKVFLALSRTAATAGVYSSAGDSEEQVVDATAVGLPRAGDEEKALAWASSTMYGPMGLLGVDSSVPAEDKGKLEVLVTRCCARLLAEEGRVVHCYLEDDEAAVRSMRGWSKAPWRAHWLFKPYPKQDS